MAQYIWFEASASTPTPRSAPPMSTLPAQHLGLKTSGSTRLDQYFWLNASDSRPVAYHPRLNTFGATPTSITQNLWLNTYGSKPLPRHLLHVPLPIGQRLWLNTSGSTPLAQYLWVNTSGSIYSLNISDSIYLTERIWPIIKGLIHLAPHKLV